MAFPGGGVFEAQHAGVQGLAFECRRAGQRGIRYRRFAGFCRPTSIDRVADDRMTEMRHVDANLMGAPRRQPAFDQRGRQTEAYFGPVAGERVFAATGQHGHFDAVLPAAADIAFDLAGGRLRRSPNKGGIGAFDRPVGELSGQPLVRLCGFCRDHDAAGILVEPVDDTGPPDAADTLQAVATMEDQRVDQRTGQVSRRRMHHHAGRFVDHDQMVVFKNDVKRDVLAMRYRVYRCRYRQAENVVRFDPVGGLGYRRARFGERQIAVLDKPLEIRARPVGQGGRQQPVDPFAGGPVGHADFDRGVRGIDCRIDCGIVDIAIVGIRDLGHAAAYHSRRPTRRGSGTMQALKALVIGMGVLIVIAVVVLIVGVMNRPTKNTQPTAETMAAPPIPFTPQSILLPPGAEIAETRIGDGRIVLRLALPDGSGRLVIVDAASGQVTGTVDLKTADPEKTP